MSYTTESESPEAYHLWIGLSVLASAIRRNVWLNQGIYLLYPNLFTILVGPAGRTGKSTAMRMGRKILQGVETIQFGPDSVTREDLIDILAKSGKKQKYSAITLHSTELSSLIDPSGIKMIQFLTDIYDCDWNPKGWKYSTKNSGKSTINQPVLNVLSGTTVSWIAEGLPPAAVEHGFTSRTVFVYEEDPRYLKPFPNEPPPVLVQKLINDLDHISRIEGEFEWGPGAKDFYSELYTAIFEDRPTDYRVEGFHNRKRAHVLKLAMLLALAEHDELVVGVTDLEAAMAILDDVEINLPKTFAALGKYDRAADMDRIIQRITADSIPLHSFYDDYAAVGDVEVLNRILDHMTSARRVKKEKRDDGWWLVPYDDREVEATEDPETEANRSDDE